jgi:hypothetical protein
MTGEGLQRAARPDVINSSRGALNRRAWSMNKAPRWLDKPHQLLMGHQEAPVVRESAPVTLLTRSPAFANGHSSSRRCRAMSRRALLQHLSFTPLYFGRQTRSSPARAVLHLRRSAKPLSPNRCHTVV